MPVITYTAVDRGELASGHTATTSYQIETDFQSFPRTQSFKRNESETLAGAPESWLDAVQWEYEVKSDLILPADQDDWRELFSSVGNREQFQIDFTGTIASPGTDVNVSLIDDSVREEQIAAVGFQYSFRVRVWP